MRGGLIPILVVIILVIVALLLLSRLLWGTLGLRAEMRMGLLGGRWVGGNNLVTIIVVVIIVVVILALLGIIPGL